MEEKVRQAVASGKRLVKTPGFDLRIMKSNVAAGWVRVKAVRVDGEHGLVDVKGNLVQLSTTTEVELPLAAR